MTPLRWLALLAAATVAASPSAAAVTADTAASAASATTVASAATAVTAATASTTAPTAAVTAASVATTTAAATAATAASAVAVTATTAATTTTPATAATTVSSATTSTSTSTEEPSPAPPILPPEIKICSVKDPQINDCILRSANKMIPHLARGLAEAGLPSMDPLQVAWLALPEGNALLPSLAFNVSHTQHRGFRGARVRWATLRPETFSLELLLAMPRYSISGLYSVNGSVLGFLALSGEGPFTVTARDALLRLRVDGAPERRAADGAEYLRIRQLGAFIDMADLHFELHQLFGSPSLSNATNRVLNWYSKSLIRNLAPVANHLFSEMYEGLLQKFFDAVPYRRLFRDVQPLDSPGQRGGRA
ncbi:hypothetical protein R5R35_004095 [Gryllus longicercus]|uniref:Uncharacterized protein n=1 Tax=Gryllus longicercus TaxID=2509291 RepID=A0AAN9Z4G1_9ORTH